MKSKVWMRAIALVVLLGSAVGLSSCKRLGTYIDRLRHLTDLPNTSSARLLSEGEQVTARYDLTAVREISLSTKIDCHLYQSEEARLEVIAPSTERLSDLYHRIEGDKLVIYDRALKGRKQSDSVDLAHHLAINLYLPDVQEIDLSGACTLEAKTPLKAHKLSIDVSGAGFVKADKVDCDALEVDCSGAVRCEIGALTARRVDADLSGAVSLSLGGVTEHLEGDFSGAIHADLGELKSRTAMLEASGACSVQVYATDRLECEVSGTASLEYAREPKEKRIEKSGMASVTAR